MGSLWAARRSASLATSSGTPDISYITLPGFTTATQYSGAPLPLPILVSAGFLVMGLSGYILIQILPPLLTWRVIAIRAASTCWLVTQPGSSALSPYSPKLTSPPLYAFPAMVPFCFFLYFTFFGANIYLTPSNIGFRTASL